MRFVLIGFLVSCGGYFESGEPSPDHYKDQVSNTFKIENQDDAFLLYRARLADHYNERVPNLLQHNWDENKFNVWWSEDYAPCPYDQERNAFIQCKNQDCPRRCVAGQTWGAAEVYVATYQKDPSKVCGTALVHEYGHVLRDQFKDGADGDHSDDEFWNLTTAVGMKLCQRFNLKDSNLDQLLEDQWKVEEDLRANGHERVVR